MAAMTAQEFNRYTGRAKIMAEEEPVFITERGLIKYVLLSIKDFEELKYSDVDGFLKNPFAMSEEEYFEFEIPRHDWQFEEVDFD